jgi:hypothetical protein
MRTNRNINPGGADDGIYRQHVKSKKTAYRTKNKVLRKITHPITNAFPELIYDIHHADFALCFCSF